MIKGKPVWDVALLTTLNRKLALLALALVAVVAVGAATSTAGRGPGGAIPLATPQPLSDAMVSALLAAAAADSRAGVTPGGRSTLVRPERFWESAGVCATDTEPHCAVVAVYDYATNAGSNVVLTLDAQPRVVRVDRNIVVPLTPEEDRRGYEVAEAIPAVAAFLAQGYQRTLSHEFAPSGPADICARHRCVALDWRDLGDLSRPQITAIVDLTTGNIVESSWDR